MEAKWSRANNTVRPPYHFVWGKWNFGTLIENP